MSVRRQSARLQKYSLSQDSIAIQKNTRRVKKTSRPRKPSTASAEDVENTDDVIQRRKEAIIHKLNALGWADELALMNPLDFEKQDLVHQPQNLTPRIWNKIKPTLIQFMENIKTGRICDERLEQIEKRTRIFMQILQKYADTRLDSHEILPRAADIYCMANVKSIVEDTPADVDVTIDDFAELLATLPQLAQEWRRSKDAELVQIWNDGRARRRFSDLEMDLSHLWLVTTYFTCSGCPTMHIAYPEVLTHECATSLQDAFGWGGDKLRDDQVPFIRLGVVPWNYRHGIFWPDLENFPHVSRLIKTCGFDPKIATPQEMDEADLILECTACTERHPLEPSYMGWRKAMVHMLNEKCYSMTWTLLSSEEKAEANLTGLSKPPQIPNSSVYSDTTLLCCSRCNDKMASYSLQNHLKVKHGRSNGILFGRDFYIPYNTQQSQ